MFILLKTSIMTLICLSCVSCEGTNQRDVVEDINEMYNFNKQLLINANLSKFINSENETKDTSSNNLIAESRGKGHMKKDKKDMMSKILPLMIIPFLVSTAMIPIMLVSLKAMLLKSMMIGKLAVLLLIFNLFRRRTDGGGVYTHNVKEVEDKELTMAHYGYGGNEEYGAYVNKRSFLK